MLRIFFVIISVVSLSLYSNYSIGQVTAQNVDSNTVFQFSLQQAIEYAYQHQKDLVNAQIDTAVADAQVKETIGYGLPQITASGDVRDYPKIPTTAIPDFITPTVYGVLKDNNIGPLKDPGPIQLLPVQFGTQWNATLGVNGSMLIFNPTYLVGIKASKSFRDLSQKNLTRAKIETNIAVSKAYYIVLVTNERLKLLAANTKRLKESKQNTEAMLTNGFVEKMDVNWITIAYNNAANEEEKSTRLAALGLSLLKFQMGMNLGANLTLTDTLNYAGIEGLSIGTETPDVTKRIEYAILKNNYALQEYNLKRYKSGYYPSLSAYGSYSTNALRNSFNLFDLNEQWYPTAVVGATLSLTIFDGTQREYRIKQANLNLRKIENDIANAENTMTLQVLTARATLQNAMGTYTTQKNNLNLANEIVSMAGKKYEQGVGSNLELIGTETSLREAQTNYYNAIYEALVAKLELDKSLGNIK